MDRPPAARTPAPATPELRLFDEADRGDTRGKILDAAFRRLATEGYAALSVREIAKDAGVNHALINYHFGTKDQLVIEVLDAANRRLLARQSAMYRGPGGFAEKWSQRAPLLRERPRVRLRARAGRAVGREPVQCRAARQVPAAAAGLESNSCSTPCARRWRRPSCTAWRCRPPSPPRWSACWISQFWLGMECADLLDVKQERAVHGAALDAVQWLLRWLDTQGDASPPRRAPRGSRALARPRRRSRSPSRVPPRPQPPVVWPRRARPRNQGHADDNRAPCRPGSASGWARCPSQAPCPVRRPALSDRAARHTKASSSAMASSCGTRCGATAGRGSPFAQQFQIVHSQLLKATVPYLSQHFRVLTMDGRGNGRSDRPRGQEAYSLRSLPCRLRGRARRAGDRPPGGGGPLRGHDDRAAGWPPSSRSA